MPKELKSALATNAPSARPSAAEYPITFISATEHTEFILPYPYQNKITNELRRVAKANKNTNFTNIWVEQSINDFRGQSTTEIIEKLIEHPENNSR